MGEDLRPAPELSIHSMAEHVLAVVWPSVAPFATDRDAIRLRQMSDHRRSDELELRAVLKGRTTGWRRRLR